MGSVGRLFLSSGIWASTCFLPYPLSSRWFFHSISQAQRPRLFTHELGLVRLCKCVTFILIDRKTGGAAQRLSTFSAYESLVIAFCVLSTPASQIIQNFGFMPLYQTKFLISSGLPGRRARFGPYFYIPSVTSPVFK